MRSRLFHIVKKFLAPRIDSGAPLLLGFSGGPDSLALYHILREVKAVIPLTLHLAHIDHGWREESRAEAKELEQSCPEPFHVHRLEGMAGSNLEDRCREERLAFFGKVYKEVGAQALLLAHHRDDQAETVLKRLFEGGNPIGLEPERMVRGMKVWRPLLSVPKKEIVSWITEQGLSPIEDPTNKESRFLRGRMREELLPELERLFGKGIGKNLARLGDQFKEIDTYLTEKVAPYIGEETICCKDLKDIELRHLLTKETSLSREAIDTLILLIREKKVGKEVRGGKTIFRVGRDSLLIIKHKGDIIKQL